MKLFDASVIGLDTETTGLHYPKDKAFCLSLATHNDFLSIDLRSDAHLIPALQRDINRSRALYTMHNAQFDIKMLKAAGIDLPLDRCDCSVVRACLIDEHESSVFPWGKKGDYTLDSLSQRYLKAGKIKEIWEDLALLFGGRPTRNVQAPNLCRAPWDLVRPYVERDALLALRLWYWQEDEIERQELRDIVEFERRLLPVLARAAMRGIPVNKAAAEAAVDQLSQVIDEKQFEFESAIGIRGFNVNSTPQVKDLFEPKQHKDGSWYSARNGYPLGKTASGGPSLSAEHLNAMEDQTAKDIIEIRSLIKTRDTFLKGHVIGHEYGGRVYPTINQTKGEAGGTGTGRLSYQEPAMQQIPSRNKKVAAIVKPIFIPEHGQVWLDGDMNSFEVRVFAHLVAAYNATLVEVYQANPLTDLHQWVADLMGIPRNATRQGEANAKQLNLSMIFNSGNGAIAAKLGMPWEWAEFESDRGEVIRYRKAGAEAMEVIDTYHKKVQGVRRLATVAKEIAESRGYIKTKFGRHLRFPRKYKSYKASGLLIQATSADFNKAMWLGIDQALESCGTILLNTHDSFSMSVDPDWKPIFARIREVASSLPSRVPLIMDLNGVGNTWWGALKNELGGKE